MADQSRKATGPLSGVRVLDLTSLLPGPYATMLLADMGADVIKVESRIGDLTRQIPPLVEGVGAYFLAVNRNKRSVVLDLRRQPARDVFGRLAATADVVVESFRPGRAERLGIDAETLREGNPGLVYCSLSGFGQTGPDRHLPGHDLTYLARAGILAGLRASSGETVMPPVQMADLAAGTTAAYAIAAALFRRATTGHGDVVDVAMLDTMAAWMGFHLEPSRRDQAAVASLPLSGRYPFYNVYSTRDGGRVALGTLEPLFWRDFCRAVDRPDLVARQFDDGDAREDLFQAVADIFLDRDTAEWAALIEEKDLAAEVVKDLADLAHDRQLTARDMLVTVQDPRAGAMLQVDTPVRSANRPPNPGRPAPELGEHTRAVLAETLDLTESEIDNLLSSGAASDRPETGRRIAPKELK